MSTVTPRRAKSFTVLSMTSRVLRPRKSNFTRPAASTHFIENWVAGMAERGSR